MKILVVFTGGTIGSVSGKKWISLDDSTNYTLIENYNNSDGIVFDVCSPYSILSENLSGEELSLICKVVNEKAKKGYDGIIVTHGTDTIQYTASALSYTVNAKDIPIVLVSANYPLEDERTNGNINFKSAVDFIKSKKANGVFVAYKNENEKETKIHLGTAITSHAEARDEIYSLGGKPFAFVLDGVVTLSEKAKDYTPNDKEMEVDFVKSPSVLMVTSFPGDNFNYSLDGVKAVLIKPYHSGTLATENPMLKDFSERAKETGVPVFLCNVMGGKAYDSARVYKELSLTVLPFCTIPAIYTKIWLAVSKNRDIREFVLSELSSEFSLK